MRRIWEEVYVLSAVTSNGGAGGLWCGKRASA